MSDLISRKWLMECVDEGWIKFDTEKDTNTYIHLVRDIAPSAQPERRKGKWIYRPEIGWGEAWVCSECEEITKSTIMGKPRYNFCPMCGADMRGDTDECAD